MPSPTFKPPVILQVLPELKSGGVERGTVEITQAIVKAEGRALVISAGGPMVPLITHAGGEHIELPVNKKNPLVIWNNAARIAEVIKKQKVDIVHARSRAPAWSAYLAAQKTKVPCVTTFHGIYRLGGSYKQKYNAIMAKGDRVIAVSHFVAEHIRTHYQVDERIIRVIHRGVDFKLFSPEAISPPRVAKLTQEWRVPDDLPVILVPGRLTRWKGHDVLVHALAKLPHRNFFCLMVGDSDKHPRFRAELEQQIVSQGLGGHVRIVGHTPYMAEVYALARFVVVPSVEPEAFGRVNVEAQAMGKPVITTGHGAAPETVIDGVTGWMVPPGNVKALSEAIAHALEMPEEARQAMGAKGVENARTHFSADVMREKTLEVYKELLPGY